MVQAAQLRSEDGVDRAVGPERSLDWMHRINAAGTLGVGDFGSAHAPFIPGYRWGGALFGHSAVPFGWRTPVIPPVL